MIGNLRNKFFMIALALILFIPYNTNIKAEETLNWNDVYKNITDKYNDNELLKKNMELLINKLNEKKYNFMIIQTTPTFDSQMGFRIAINSVDEPIQLYAEDNTIYTTIRSRKPLWVLNNGQSGFENDFNRLKDLTEEKIDAWLEEFEYWKVHGDEISYRKTTLPPLINSSFGRSNNAILYSNKNENIITIENFTNPIIIDNKNFLNGQIPTIDGYYNIFSINSGDKNYLYQKEVNLSDYSKLEWVYDVNGNLVFDLQFEVTIEDWNNLGSPYLEILGNDGNIQIINVFEEGFIPSEGGFVRGNIKIDLKDVKSMKIVWDTINSYSRAKIKIKTNYSLTENFIPKNSAENLIKVPMNNYYGIYLIPKTKGISNFSTIYLNGLYDIENRNYEFPDKDKDYTIIDKKIDYSSDIYQYLTYFDELNFVTFIVNKNYDKENPSNEEYYVQFDSNMYSYVIKETPNSEVSIENPNTGEKIEFPIDDNIEENKNIEDYLNDTKKFLKNIQKYNKEFLGLFQYLFNSFNSTIRTAIIGLFIVFVVCSIILIARGKK